MARGPQKSDVLEFFVLVDLGSNTFAAKYCLPSRALISDPPQSIDDADFHTASRADLRGRVVDDLEEQDRCQGLGPPCERDTHSAFRAPICYSSANHLAP